MNICIDAGHGGRDPGAIGRTPFRLEEKTVNLAVALRLEQILESMGHNTLMTRRQDRTLSLRARAHFANRFEADFFVSIHCNAAGTPNAEGMEVFHFPGSTSGAVGAEKVLGRMLNRFPDHRDRGVKEANFTVLRLTQMPAILVECEFLTNQEQLVFLANNQDGLADAMAEGVIEWMTALAVV
ncbi:MAG: N-acetylmuramoyl-L-alanine amidase [Bacteroidota bacterium]